MAFDYSIHACVPVFHVSAPGSCFRVAAVAGFASGRPSARQHPRRAECNKQRSYTDECVAAYTSCTARRSPGYLVFLAQDQQAWPAARCVECVASDVLFWFLWAPVREAEHFLLLDAPLFIMLYSSFC